MKASNNYSIPEKATHWSRNCGSPCIQEFATLSLNSIQSAISKTKYLALPKNKPPVGANLILARSEFMGLPSPKANFKLCRDIMHKETIEEQVEKNRALQAQ